MPTVVLVLFGLCIVASLVTMIVFMLQRRGEDGRPDPFGDRTEPRDPERDRRTAMIWGMLGLAFTILLVGAWALTR